MPDNAPATATKLAFAAETPTAELVDWATALAAFTRMLIWDIKTFSI
jgi:hypothetical protein